jgi:CHASE3 domain sensor protein
MTIRAKLYAAIVLTILGPLATTAVALHGMSQLGDSFDEVHERAQDESLAREIKFTVTDMNGWQTAYGYDGTGRFRPQFEESADKLRQDLATGEETLTDPPEQESLNQLEQEFDRFIALDEIAYRELKQGNAARVKQIFLGPELVRFEAMAATAERLAVYEAESAEATDEAFDQDRDDARRRLIAVALGAAMVIILLLVTAQDVARMALEGERSVRGRPGEGENDKPS